MSNHTQAMLEKKDRLATITFRTETGVNVASIEFLKELESAADQLAQNNQIRFVILRAEGKVFLAGANIKAMSEYDAQAARTMAEMGHRVFDKIESLPQVTIASIHGAALGGGCEVAMACDFRFAVKTANLGQPEVLLGLIPGWGGTKRLPRLVPYNTAKRIIFSGESLKAEQAQTIGLIDEIVNSPEDLPPRIQAFCEGLAKASPSAITAIKKAWKTGDEIGSFADCFSRSEAKEGMKAFLEKRPAAWSTQ